MTRFKPVLQIIFVIILIPFAKAQSSYHAGEGPLPAEFLKQDFDTLRKKLESAQPGLYLYTSKDSLDQIFEAIRGSLKKPMTSLEFFRRIAPLNKTLRNLHTRFWASAAYEKAAETVLPGFPLDIYWEDGQMYVLRNNSAQENIVQGSVIKSINGVPAAEVFQTLLDCRVRDGFNETYPIAQTIRNFSFYYAQLIGTPETFLVELTSPDGLSQVVELQGLTAPEISENRTVRYAGKYSQYSADWDAWIAKKEPALRYSLKEDVAIMTVRTFYTPIIEANGQNYLDFFKKSFTHLIKNNTRNLIIDLRNNHGGSDPVGMALLSYLHDSVFYYYRRRTAFLKPGTKAIKNGNVYEIKGRGVWTGKVKPAKEIYKGKVYVLMNGYSVSAAGEFIGHLKNINRAVFIGEEAGGNPVSFTGGESLAVDLPHSRITGTIPLQFVEMNVQLKNTGHGVIPDYEVRPGINDILNERDVEMELALKLIRNEN